MVHRRRRWPLALPDVMQAASVSVVLLVANSVPCHGVQQGYGTVGAIAALVPHGKYGHTKSPTGANPDGMQLRPRWNQVWPVRVLSL